MGSAPKRRRGPRADAVSTPDRSDRPARSGLFGRKPAKADVDDLPKINSAAALNVISRRVADARADPPAAGPDPETVRSALSAIEAALFVIDDVRETLEEAYEVTLTAQSLQDAGGRALLAESYDELRLSINRTLEGADAEALGLIGFNARQIDVPLGGKASYTVSAMRLDVSSRGLSLNPPQDAFASFAEIAATIAELDAAVARADRAATAYCHDAKYLMARLSQAPAEKGKPSP